MLRGRGPRAAAFTCGPRVPGHAPPLRVQALPWSQAARLEAVGRFPVLQTRKLRLREVGRLHTGPGLNPEPTARQGRGRAVQSPGVAGTRPSALSRRYWLWFVAFYQELSSLLPCRGGLLQPHADRCRGPRPATPTPSASQGGGAVSRRPGGSPPWTLLCPAVGFAFVFSRTRLCCQCTAWRLCGSRPQEPSLRWARWRGVSASPG